MRLPLASQGRDEDSSRLAVESIDRPMSSVRPRRLPTMESNATTPSAAELPSAADLAATNSVRFPNESVEYRDARQALLVEEIELRRQVERVASLRRALPSGGALTRNYQFTAEDGSDVTLADLFGQHHTLIVYSYMFGPQRQAPCPHTTCSCAGTARSVISGVRRSAATWPTLDRIRAAPWRWTRCGSCSTPRRKAAARTGIRA